MFFTIFILPILYINLILFLAYGIDILFIYFSLILISIVISTLLDLTGHIICFDSDEEVIKYYQEHPEEISIRI